MKTRRFRGGVRVGSGLAKTSVPAEGSDWREWEGRGGAGGEGASTSSRSPPAPAHSFAHPAAPAPARGSFPWLAERGAKFLGAGARDREDVCVHVSTVPEDVDVDQLLALFLATQQRLMRGSAVPPGAGLGRSGTAGSAGTAGVAGAAGREAGTDTGNESDRSAGQGERRGGGAPQGPALRDPRLMQVAIDHSAHVVSLHMDATEWGRLVGQGKGLRGMLDAKVFGKVGEGVMGSDGEEGAWGGGEKREDSSVRVWFKERTPVGLFGRRRGERRLVGFGRVVSDGLAATLWDVAVHPVLDSQSRASNRLVQRLVLETRMDGVSDISMLCDPFRVRPMMANEFVADADGARLMQWRGPPEHAEQGYAPPF